jgi:2-polyprenyl-6-hydroxyphenyl methylase / 3-demethylubiquinone-9 3-methyltransferase
MHYDQHEINKFNDLAHHWWNLDGEFKTLHLINPIRMKFIQDHISLADKTVIDVGCGGGILSEALAAAGGAVTGIDLAPQSIEVADLHLYESELSVAYECVDIETKAASQMEQFDVLTCMEMLEHVPNPEIIIENCAKLLKTGGIAFFSTLNRNLKSYLLGVLAAEYIMRIIPKGTHEYAKFIKPSELRSMLTKYGLEIIDLKGLNYNPFIQKVSLTNDTQINYIVACRKI